MENSKNWQSFEKIHIEILNNTIITTKSGTDSVLDTVKPHE